MSRRQSVLVAAEVLDATTGATYQTITPSWATSAIFALSVTDVNGSSDTVDYTIDHVIRKQPGVAAVSTDTAGDGSNDEVQLVTLTGGPDQGTFTLAWTGESANIAVNTGPIPYNASAARVADELNRAIAGTAYAPPGPPPVGVTRAGAGTSGDPYIYTVTFSGPGVDKTDVDEMTVNMDELFTHATLTDDFQGWNGITQLTDVDDVIVQIGPYEPATTDDTGPVYRIQASLPERLAHTLAFTSTDETYTYSLWATYIGPE